MKCPRTDCPLAEVLLRQENEILTLRKVMRIASALAIAPYLPEHRVDLASAVREYEELRRGRFARPPARVC